MIRPTPGSDAWSVLDLVVRYPGQLDSVRIGERLWRPRIRSTADVLAVRRAITESGAKWSARASVCLQRLQAAGYVERCRPPRIAEFWADTIADDPRQAVTLAAADYAVGAVDPGGSREALLLILVRHTPATVREWVGPTPSGHIQRAMADLVTWGLVVPPSYRWPTPKGVALVTA